MYMRDQICGEGRLKSTSLKSLGLISGRGLLRINQRQKTDNGSSSTSTSSSATAASSATDAAATAANTGVAAMDVDVPSAPPGAAAAATADPLAGMKLSNEQMKMIESISEGYRDYQRDSGQLPPSNTAAASSSSSFPSFPAPTRDFLPDAPRLPPPQASSSSSSSMVSPPPPPVAVVRPQMEFANFKFPEAGSGGGGGASGTDEAASLPDSSTEPCDREIQVFNLESFGDKVRERGWGRESERV